MHELRYVQSVLRETGNIFPGMVICLAWTWHGVDAYLWQDFCWFMIGYNGLTYTVLYVHHMQGTWEWHIKYCKMWLFDICTFKCHLLNCACNMLSNGRKVMIICRIACRIDCFRFSQGLCWGFKCFVKWCCYVIGWMVPDTVHLESSCALQLRCVDLVVSIEVAIEVCCCFTVFSC
jgi:hypothetical protein